MTGTDVSSQFIVSLILSVLQDHLLLLVVVDSGHAVWAFVVLPGAVLDLIPESLSLLLHSVQSGVWDVCQTYVIQDGEERQVVHCDQSVREAQCEHPGFLEWLDYSNCLPLDGDLP